MFAFHVLIYAFIPWTLAFICPEPEVCTCEGVDMICNCLHNRNVTLGPIYDIDISRISVRGCNTVNIPFAAFNYIKLHYLELSDIKYLVVHPFAVTRMDSINSVILRNIMRVEIRKYGFSSLRNIDEIILSNVNVPIIEKGAFSEIRNLSNFTIINSTLHNLEPLAFFLTNVTSVRVVDSYIQKNFGISITGAQDVTFSESTLGELGDQSLFLENAESLTFHNCSLGSIGKFAIVTKALKNFALNYCTIDRMEADAFHYLVVSESFTFSHNVIRWSGVNAMIPAIAFDMPVWKNITLLQEQNWFTCDCELSWIWVDNKDGIYDSLLTNSYCIDSNETRLDQISPVFNGTDDCTDLAFIKHSPHCIDCSNSQQHIFSIFQLFVIVSVHLVVISDSFLA